MTEIMEAAAIEDKKIEIALQKELRELAYDYLFVVLTTPLKLKLSPKYRTLSKRVRWLRTNVIKPAEILLSALSPQNSIMLSEWPQDEMSVNAPNSKLLKNQLFKIHDRVSQLERLLSGRVEESCDLTVEFLADLNLHLYEILKHHFPQIVPSRGTYTKGGSGGTMHGRYIEIARIIVSEIFPGDRTIANRFFADLGK